MTCNVEGNVSVGPSDDRVLPLEWLQLVQGARRHHDGRDGGARGTRRGLGNGSIPGLQFRLGEQRVQHPAHDELRRRDAEHLLPLFHGLLPTTQLFSLFNFFKASV